MPQSPSLLPCPFCPDGGEPHGHFDGRKYDKVECHKCGASTSHFIETAELATKAWNTRPDGGDSLRALQGWADKLEHAHMQLRAQGYRDTGLSVEGARIHAETEMSAAKRQHFSDLALAAKDGG